MKTTYADGLRACSDRHPAIRAEAIGTGSRIGLAQCAETHAELVEAGARLGVLATLLAVGLAWWWGRNR